MATGYTVTTGKITLTSAATKSAVLLNPAGPKATIFGIDVSFDGSAAAASVQIDLYKVVTIGSAAGTTTTPVGMDATNTGTASTTCLTALTVEPTTVTVVRSWYVTPFGGLLPYQLPLGREYVMAPAGVRWGLRWTTASGVTPDMIVNVDFEE